MHRCQQRDNYFPAWNKPEKGKKMMEEGIRRSCKYFFPAVSKKKKNKTTLFCSHVWMWHFTLFPFYCFLSNFKGSGYLTQALLWQAVSRTKGCQCGQAAAALSSGLHPWGGTMLSGGYQVISQELMLIARELMLLSCRVYSIHPLAQTLQSWCLPAWRRLSVHLNHWRVKGLCKFSKYEQQNNSN